ncbi:protein phosphatase 2C domain-containing protein [Nocardia sp. CDC159]|uniref:Protein phosphatase 2C domain-containing protein n=1 Tax=Nocardia pulmonis TaxID=2951408 RepID=A0A9X2E7K2_9NOCA|nr:MULTISPECIES: protein phosphatase 2C domain-containing protein [Nocardia]MCM6775577.1 protein phosphatase 2C domain-containing protein [Nocardia pulmonis]MCM6787689.1 protein phosphatase 2C domain-containing protein [Nocardia sp. CDC159]
MHNAVTTAITRRELIRLAGIEADSVSRRGGRSINADAVATRTDPSTGRTAFVVADGIGDHLLAARAARCAAAVAAAVGTSRGAVPAILAAQDELHRQFPEPAADTVLAIAVVPTADQPDAPAEIAWVGDCRAYRWNGRVLHQITTDHTVAELLRAHGREPLPRMSHLVTTSVRTVTADAIGRAGTGSSHGRFLLCTDGIHKMLDIMVVKELLAAGISPGRTAEALVDTALRVGGTDNTTALVVDRA